jgi:hypothetical protein
MSTSVSTYTATTTRTHVITYLTDKMLRSLGNIIRDSGLSMDTFSSLRPDYERGMKAWLASGHFEKVILEVFSSDTNQLVKRWDFELYSDGAGGLEFWFNPDEIRYHLLKAGRVPSTCKYAIIVVTKEGRPDVSGWSSCSLRDTSQLRQFSLGTTISASSSGTRTHYWS